jgi:acetyl-CoA carboxylase biotin carboxylase subunit
MFEKILVANRGEIALRIIRCCVEMGIPTVAVYSSVDRDSLAVQAADEAVFIGPPLPLESYLNTDAIIAAARQTGAEAIHPGYGFLAENPSFARRCEEEGIVFIGPSSNALALVGDKLRARETMVSAEVPVIPGMKGAKPDPSVFAAEAERVGYPVLVKASAGGGGKGMRIVRSERELKDAVAAAGREARSAFGDETVYLEKLIVDPRHIEFQVLSDTHGNTVHLFERECSIQRRHQKIVEETPSVALDPALRCRMGETAVEVIRAAEYTNAGTVEFLLDAEGNFYFLEVNARIQVEHPITELVTGVDLVRQQILIAAGEPIPFRQEDLSQRGHAIECRIYAEDPVQGFLPSSGRVLFLREPSGPGIRHDCGIYQGCEVPVYYDPILSKLIAWGEDRETARLRMKRALQEFCILGIQTTIGFLADLMSHPEFIAGHTTTSFIESYMSDWKISHTDEVLHLALAAAAIEAMNAQPSVKQTSDLPTQPTPWQTLGSWSLGAVG